MQFGDDIMGSATDEMRAMLERKNQWKRDFHIGRLQEQGMVPHKASQPRRDPEDDAVDGFDRPSPSPPPESRRLQAPQTHTPEHFDIGYDTAEEAAMPASSNGVISAISNGASSGANSLVADLGAGAVHALAYGAAAGTAAVVKGSFRAIKHLATGTNPLSVPDDEEEEERAAEPMSAHPKAKAQAKSSWFGGSSGSQDKQSPPPYPAKWSHEAVSAYNGVHEVNSSEEEAPGPAAAARRPRNRGGLANRDLRFARETLAADPTLGRRRRG